MRKAKTTSSAPDVPARRKHRTVQQRREMVEAYERSGLSPAEFCEREAVSMASLANWRRQLKGETAKPTPPAGVGATPAGAFIELGASRPLDVGIRVRIELGAGVVLELSRS